MINSFKSIIILILIVMLLVILVVITILIKMIYNGQVIIMIIYQYYNNVYVNYSKFSLHSQCYVSLFFQLNTELMTFDYAPSAVVNDERNILAIVLIFIKNIIF